MSSASDAINFSLPLTPREREVLSLRAQGLSEKEVARELGIELGTVKAHAHAAMLRLRHQHGGKWNATRAVAYCIVHNIIEVTV